MPRYVFILQLEYLPDLSGPANRALAPRMRATPAICYSLLCLRASHARAAFALQTAPIAAPRGRTGASRIFAASPQPVPRVCPRSSSTERTPEFGKPSRSQRIRDGCPRRRAASARAASGHRCRAQKGEAGEARQAAAEQAPRRSDGHTTGAALDVAKAAAWIGRLAGTSAFAIA